MADFSVLGSKVLGGLEIGILEQKGYQDNQVLSRGSIISLPSRYFDNAISKKFVKINSQFTDFINKGSYVLTDNTHNNYTPYKLVDVSDTEYLGAYLTLNSIDLSSIALEENIYMSIDYYDTTTHELKYRFGSHYLQDSFVISNNEDEDNLNYYSLVKYIDIDYVFLVITSTEASTSGGYNSLTEYRYKNSINVANYRFQQSISNVNYDELEAIASTSVPSFGFGSFDNTSDVIDLPPIPSLSATSSGLITIYTPTPANMQSFSNWLWSTDLLDKLFTDPLSLIIGLYISPIAPSTQIVSEIKLGGKNTEVVSNKITHEYEYFSLGSINLAEYYGNFIDYQSECTIYLPYVGYKQIDIDEFMSGTIYLDYLINFATGTCIAFIRAVRGNLKSVVYQYSGNIFSEISITAQDARSLQSTLISSAVSVGTSLATGNPLSIASSATSAVTNTMSATKQFQRSGQLSTNAGFISVQQAYLIFKRPVQSLSKGLQKDKGYASNLYAKLSSLTGFTKVAYCDLSNITCTDDERSTIEELLKDGIYI